jgi:hypothetical protein
VLNIAPTKKYFVHCFLIESSHFPFYRGLNM